MTTIRDLEVFAAELTALGRQLDAAATLARALRERAAETAFAGAAETLTEVEGAASLQWAEVRRLGDHVLELHEQLCAAKEQEVSA